MQAFDEQRRDAVEEIGVGSFSDSSPMVADGLDVTVFRCARRFSEGGARFRLLMMGRARWSALCFRGVHRESRSRASFVS